MKYELNNINMDINKLERANTLARCLLPKVNKLLDIHNYSDGTIGETLKCLLGIDEDFSNKFTQLLSEVKQRYQKEFDEL